MRGLKGEGLGGHEVGIHCVSYPDDKGAVGPRRRGRGHGGHGHHAPPAAGQVAAAVALCGYYDRRVVAAVRYRRMETVPPSTPLPQGKRPEPRGERIRFARVEEALSVRKPRDLLQLSEKPAWNNETSDDQVPRQTRQVSGFLSGYRRFFEHPPKPRAAAGFLKGAVERLPR
jgi:hypothetical protein